MSSKRYTDELKIEAVRQVTDRGFKVADVADARWPPTCVTLASAAAGTVFTA